MANKNRILVHIEGGVVQGVFASDPSAIEVVIRDADIEGTTDNIFEDEDGYQYAEFEPPIEPWSNLEAQPFERPVFMEGTSVLVPDPVTGTDDAWSHEFEGVIEELWCDDGNGQMMMATVRDQDDDRFSVEVHRLTHA